MRFTLVFLNNGNVGTIFLYILVLYNSLRPTVSTHPRVKKQVDVLVEKSLILLISCTEILQELMSQFHNLLHSDIFTLKRKMQEDILPLFTL